MVIQKDKLLNKALWNENKLRSASQQIHEYINLRNAERSQRQ